MFSTVSEFRNGSDSSSNQVYSQFNDSSSFNEFSHNRNRMWPEMEAVGNDVRYSEFHEESQVFSYSNSMDCGFSSVEKVTDGKFNEIRNYILWSVNKPIMLDTVEHYYKMFQEWWRQMIYMNASLDMEYFVEEFVDGLSMEIQLELKNRYSSLYSVLYAYSTACLIEHKMEIENWRSKFNLPMFDGSNLRCWIINLPKLFGSCEITEELKWEIIGSSMSVAWISIWFSNYKYAHSNISWSEFEAALYLRFGELDVDNETGNSFNNGIGNENSSLNEDELHIIDEVFDERSIEITEFVKVESEDMNAEESELSVGSEAEYDKLSFEDDNSIGSNLGVLDTITDLPRVEVSEFFVIINDEVENYEVVNDEPKPKVEAQEGYSTQFLHFTSLKLEKSREFYGGLKRQNIFCSSEINFCGNVVSLYEPPITLMFNDPFGNRGVASRMQNRWLLVYYDNKEGSKVSLFFKLNLFFIDMVFDPGGKFKNVILHALDLHIVELSPREGGVIIGEEGDAKERFVVSGALEVSHKVSDVVAEAVRNQHAVDVYALLSATQELQKLKQELAKTSDAKNQALNHADDATKIAEIHVEKVEILSDEILRLKSMLDSRIETEDSERAKLVSNLNLEIETLRQELQRAKGFEDKLEEKEASLEQLNVELEAAKMAKSYARKLVDEIENSKDEEEKSKKAMESLASALHEVSSEAREAKEKLLYSQEEYENYEAVLHCLEELLHKCHLGSIDQLVVILKKLTHGALLSPFEGPEEFCEGIIRCFRAILTSLRPCSDELSSCKQVERCPMLLLQNDHQSPLLFSSQSNMKSDRQLINDFLSSEMMYGEGNLLAHLLIVGYKVTYLQSPLVEYNFRVMDLFEVFQDRVRLCKVVQFLQLDSSILLKMVVPSDTQKKGLVKGGIDPQYLKHSGVSLCDGDGMLIKEESVLWSTLEVGDGTIWVLTEIQIRFVFDPGGTCKSSRRSSSEIGLHSHDKLEDKLVFEEEGNVMLPEIRRKKKLLEGFEPWLIDKAIK